MACAVHVCAEKPVLDHLNPAGGAAGTTNIITLSGSFEPWPPKAWVEEGGITFQFETNKGTARVEVAEEAAPGPRLVRLFNDEGASEPRVFVVGPGREIGETEPNDHFLKPQSLEELPLTINGRLDKNGDVDSYSIELRRGEWLDARLDSYVLMGKLDGVLRLVTPRGEQIEWNHDFGSLDPRLIWRAPGDRKVVLQVFGFAYPANSAIRLSGGEGAVYRLHLKKGMERPLGRCDLPLEKEPNDLSSTTEILELPARFAGTICNSSDEDRFLIEVKKDQFICVAVRSYEIGSPLDPWVRIEDESGKQLARNDDAEGTIDPRLEWKAPADGQYVVAIGSVTHRGGDSFRYEMGVDLGEPDYRATAESSSVALAPGGTNELKLKVDFLRGYTNTLEVLARNLPEQVQAAPVQVPSKGGEVLLAFVAETNAPPSNGPFQVIIREAGTDRERTVPVEFTTRTVNNGVPGGYTRLLVERTDHLWLTVLPKPSESAAGEAEK